MAQAAEALKDVRSRQLKADIVQAHRTNLTPRGSLVDQARKNAGLEVKQMADWMGVSESFLLRGFKDQEHLSYQRLQLVAAQSRTFHREFLIVQAAEVEGVEVVTEIRVPRTA